MRHIFSFANNALNSAVLLHAPKNLTCKGVRARGATSTATTATTRHHTSRSSSIKSTATTGKEREVSDAFSTVVPNTESTARDHLANERTFLAWARTGLALVGLGVGIDALLRNELSQRKQFEQQHQHNNSIHPSTATSSSSSSSISSSSSSSSMSPNDQDEQYRHRSSSWRVHAPASGLVVSGGGVLAYSTVRYYRVQRCLMQGAFPLNRAGMSYAVASTAIITLAALMMTVADDLVDTSQWHPLANLRVDAPATGAASTVTATAGVKKVAV